MDKATKDYLQNHLQKLEDEYQELLTQQNAELVEIENKVNSFRKQLVDGINAKYGGLIDRKNIELDNTRRMLNNEDTTNS